MINLNLTEITVKREIRLLRVKLELFFETIQFIKLYPRFINSFVLSNRPANRRNLKNTNYYTPIGTKRNDALFSLSPSFLFSPFFLPFPPVQIRRNCLLKTENWTLAIFHTCRAISPPIGCGANDYCRVDNCRIQ